MVEHKAKKRLLRIWLHLATGRTLNISKGLEQVAHDTGALLTVAVHELVLLMGCPAPVVWPSPSAQLRIPSPITCVVVLAPWALV